MAKTLLPDTNDTSDLIVSALGGVMGLLAYHWLTSTPYGGRIEKKSPPSVSLALGPKIYGVGFVTAGVLAGHQLHQHLHDDFETEKLLGG